LGIKHELIIGGGKVTEEEKRTPKEERCNQPVSHNGSNRGALGCRHHHHGSLCERLFSYDYTNMDPTSSGSK
jgi:hypothetical protein